MMSKNVMKIVIPGGSGQVGSLLGRAFQADGHEVVVLSRKPRNAPWRVVGWDAETRGAWTAELEGADVIINLAGYTVNSRYSSKVRKMIIESRVNSTRVIGESISQAKRPPKLWLQASTATIYAHTFGAPHDEANGVIGGGEEGVPETWRYSIDVAKAWERAAMEANVPMTRKVILRSAMIMSPDRGGIFDTLLTLVRIGLGGQSGNGRQFVSWIHYKDFVDAINWLIKREDIEGIVNVAAPNPLPNKEFMRAIREAWGMPVGLPASKWMLEIGAFLMRTETELILKSRRVVSGRLMEAGFIFAYPDWENAVTDLCWRWRERG